MFCPDGWTDNAEESLRVHEVKMKYLGDFLISMVMFVILYGCAWQYSVNGVEPCRNIIIFLSNTLAVIAILGSLIKMSDKTKERIAKRPWMFRMTFWTCYAIWLFYLIWNGWFVTGIFWTIGSFFQIGVTQAVLKEYNTK